MARHTKCDCERFLRAEIIRIKHELNGMALIGCQPMWSSLIARLDDLQIALQEHAHETQN